LPAPTPAPSPHGTPPPERPAVLAVSARTLEFQGVAQSGQSYTLPVLIVLYGGNTGQRWNARATTFTGGSWLSLSPLGGEDDATLQATATVGKLAPGGYT